MNTSTTSCAVDGTERRIMLFSVIAGRWKDAGPRAGIASDCGGPDSVPTVIERSDAARQRFAQRAETARRIERFVLGAVERKMFETFERLHPLRAAVANRFARLAVFVDEAVHAPRQVVLQRIGRKLRQRADPYLDVANFGEAVRQFVRGDADEPSARDRHCGMNACGVVGDRGADARSGAHVFGQVEVMRRLRPCGSAPRSPRGNTAAR